VPYRRYAPARRQVAGDIGGGDDGGGAGIGHDVFDLVGLVGDVE
jgi:hypothetical protein